MSVMLLLCVLTTGVYVQEAVQYLQRLSSGISCTSQVASKRSCMYHNVCLLFGDHSSGSQTVASNVITAVRLGGRSALQMSNVDDLLQQQLSSALSSFGKVQVFAPADNIAAEALAKGNAVATTAVHLWNSAVANAASGRHGNVTLTEHHMQHVIGTSNSTPAVLVQDGLVALLQSAPHEVMTTLHELRSPDAATHARCCLPRPCLLLEDTVLC